MISQSLHHFFLGHPVSLKNMPGISTAHAHIQHIQISVKRSAHTPRVFYDMLRISQITFFFQWPIWDSSAWFKKKMTCKLGMKTINCCSLRKQFTRLLDLRKAIVIGFTNLVLRTTPFFISDNEKGNSKWCSIFFFFSSSIIDCFYNDPAMHKLHPSKF